MPTAVIFGKNLVFSLDIRRYTYAQKQNFLSKLPRRRFVWNWNFCSEWARRVTEYPRIPNENCEIMGENGISNHCVFDSFMLWQTTRVISIEIYIKIQYSHEQRGLPLPFRRKTRQRRRGLNNRFPRRLIPRAKPLFRRHNRPKQIASSVRYRRPFRRF